MKKKTKTISGSKFFNKKDWSYHFPFITFDPTPGGSNLGRIEWRIEPIAKRGNIVKIILQVKQTRDKRYAGKIFELEVDSPSIFGRTQDHNDFLGRIWTTYWCSEHKTLALEAYPANEHNELVIEKSSGIGIRIKFVSQSSKK